MNKAALEEEKKLPATIMTKWKELNCQANFSKRVDKGPTDNPAMRFMKENYMKICQERPARSSKDSSRTASDSPVIVPEKSLDEVTVAKKVLLLSNFPPQ